MSICSVLLRDVTSFTGGHGVRLEKWENADMDLTFEGISNLTDMPTYTQDLESFYWLEEESSNNGTDNYLTR